MPESRNDKQLFETLFEHHYKIINFPGCIVDKDKYIDWHKKKGVIGAHNNTACEGFGVTLRLTQAKDDFLKRLKSFIEGERFNRALAEKFGIDYEAVNVDGGIQKYLDGYEISPHPDIRKKALTFMVNINPASDSEKSDHHTHYLEFDKAHQYVQRLWEGNPHIDRCWVPWDWCRSVSQQRENNNIVIFSPSNNTMHGVKANYNHLRYQRTQLYGNLWYHESNVDGVINSENLSMDSSKFVKSKDAFSVRNFIPAPVKEYS